MRENDPRPAPSPPPPGKLAEETIWPNNHHQLDMLL